MVSGTTGANVSVMELIGQGDGTILYGDRSAELVAAGGSKLFKAPFRGYVKGVHVVADDGKERLGLTVKINGVPIIYTDNAFEVGDTIAVVGLPMPGASGDRIGVEVGVAATPQESEDHS